MKNMFNTYYLNYGKAYELSMLINNKLSEQITEKRDKETAFEGSGEVAPGFLQKLPILEKALPSIDVEGDLAYKKSKVVEDLITVVHTKSTILRPVYSKAVDVKKLNESKIGSLIKLNNVALEVVNKEDALAMKAMMSGMFNSLSDSLVEGVELSSLFEILLKDAAYILMGVCELNSSEEKIMFKIPMTLESELENNYSLSDLEIGKVSVLGIYRGSYSASEIENKANSLMFAKDTSAHSYTDEIDDIEDGVLQEQTLSVEKGMDIIHYLDIVAIVQDIVL